MVENRSIAHEKILVYLSCQLMRPPILLDQSLLTIGFPFFVLLWVFQDKWYVGADILLNVNA